mmetsp:Transcript_71548/g.220884  ORF Transcript_71548/g.220884 Transcript_71548/m.220884 type:complete len:649 (+) Transcript_71548:101-2047(+)
MAYAGVVHSWNDPRGYGFITSDDLQRETFFGRSALAAELRDCARIFKLQGKKVTFDLDVEKTGKNSTFVASTVQLIISTGDQAVGTVKRYNPTKGFGFISSASLDEDPYFAKKDVPLTMQNAQLEGTLVSFVLELGQDGKSRAASLKFKETPPPQLALPGLAAPAAAAQQAALPALQAALLVPLLAKLAPALSGAAGKAPLSAGNPLAAAKALAAPGKMFPGKPAVPAAALANALAVPATNQALAAGSLLAAALAVGSGGSRPSTASTAAGSRSSGHAAAGSKGSPGDVLVPADGQGMSGTVVSYHKDRGYGFIAADCNIGGDLYFRGEDCTDGPFEAGNRVAFSFKAMHDGRNAAKNVVPGMVDGETYNGTVYSYSQRNGYGFIKVPAHPEGVYFKKAVVPEHLQEVDLRGWEVRFVGHLLNNGKARAGRLEFPASPSNEKARADSREQEEDFVDAAPSRTWEEQDDEVRHAADTYDPEAAAEERGEWQAGQGGAPPRFVPPRPGWVGRQPPAAERRGQQLPHQEDQADRSQWGQWDQWDEGWEPRGWVPQPWESQGEWPAGAPVRREPIDSRLRQQQAAVGGAVGSGGWPGATEQEAPEHSRKRPLSPLKAPDGSHQQFAPKRRSGLSDWDTAAGGWTFGTFARKW